MTLSTMAKPPLVLTMGEPASIAPEITAKLWQLVRQGERSDWQFFVIGDPELYRRQGLEVAIITDAAETFSTFASALPVMVESLPVTVTAGTMQSQTAAATITSISRAVTAVQQRQAAAVITNPIHKSQLQSAGFGFPGHTEYLENLSRLQQPSQARHAVMMLSSERLQPPLRVVPITVHLALREAVNALTAAKIITAATITDHDLRHRLGIATPRLALAGLNPHAGENGTMGREEIEIMTPAIIQLRGRGVNITGPYPADSLFHSAARQYYDAVLCPTHDQALIPLKSLDFSGGVNVTLGLEFIRTSPDHGTALDIAGQNRADPTSLFEAVKLAAQMVQNVR